MPMTNQEPKFSSYARGSPGAQILFLDACDKEYNCAI